MVWGPYNPVEQATTRMFSPDFVQEDHQKISAFLTEFETLANQVPNFAGDIAASNGTFTASILWGKLHPHWQELAEPYVGVRPKTYYALLQYLRETEKSEEARIANRKRRNMGPRASAAQSSTKGKAKSKPKTDAVKPSTSKPKKPYKSDDRKDLTKILGDDGKLLPAEIERRNRLGLCSYCGDKHARDDCPKTGKPNVSARAGEAEEVSGFEEVPSDSATESEN